MGAAAAPLRNVIVFALGSARYAVELRWVREVLTLGHVTPVPRSPPAILGVVNVRGAIVPVLDLEALLGGRAPEAPVAAAAGESAILLEVEETSAALRVTSVVEVASLRPADPAVPDSLLDSTGRAVPLVAPPELVARARQATQGAAGALLAELGS
ncbi:MAG TPA: chemotaxis protein CheW [Kofleriaceae bacterium]|nr:chemotaxis protein CheW [Kofleriaceae bacterium]